MGRCEDYGGIRMTKEVWSRAIIVTEFFIT